MTDKEMMEEIIETWNFSKEILDHPPKVFEVEEIDWLIKKAKQALKMDEELNGTKYKHGYKDLYRMCNKNFAILYRQNQRYREVIEKSLHEVRYGYSDIAEEILLEALKGE